jgi:transcriptional regulator with XRE-family HTH domain
MSFKARQRLRKEMHRKTQAGINGTKQAAGCNLSQTYFSQILNGRLNPTSQEMKNISTYYELPPAELFSDEWVAEG